MFVSALIFQIAFAQSKPVIRWPSESGFDRSPASLQKPACRDAIDFISGKILPTAKETAEPAEKEALQTSQFLVIHRGKAVLEWYNELFAAQNPAYLWSASKAVTAMLVGRAIHDEKLAPNGEKFSLDTPISIFFPEEEWKYRRDVERFRQLKIRHLLSMSAGFEWEESYESSPTNSSFLPMLYGKGRGNMSLWARSKTIAVEPGKGWNYSGGNSNILMDILTQLYGQRDFFVKSLFSPLGMRSARFGRDGRGYAVGSSYAFMNVEDMARLGYFLIQNGTWKGQRFLPVWWMHWALAPSEAYTAPNTVVTPKLIIKEDILGNGVLWLNHPIQGYWAVKNPETGATEVTTKIENRFTASPQDMFFLAGHYGQLIIVIPSQDLVIVRAGQDKEYWTKIDQLVPRVIACIKQ